MSNDSQDPKNNRAVLKIADIIKSFVSSATEAKIGALFISSQQAISVQTTAEEMDHAHLPIPIQTDNTTALGFIMINL